MSILNIQGAKDSESLSGSRLSTYDEILSQEAEKHVRICQETLTVNQNVNLIDFFILSIVNRSLAITDAVLSLCSDQNYIVAFMLLRIQLDNLLILNYILTTKDAEVIASSLFKEGRICRKTKKGRLAPVKDFELRKCAEKSFPWLNKVYEETSKMIHFSNKLLFQQMAKIDEDNRCVTLSVSSSSSHFPIDSIREFYEVFIETSKSISALLASYKDARKQFNN